MPGPLLVTKAISREGQEVDGLLNGGPRVWVELVQNRWRSRRQPEPLEGLVHRRREVPLGRIAAGRLDESMSSDSLEEILVRADDQRVVVCALPGPPHVGQQGVGEVGSFEFLQSAGVDRLVGMERRLGDTRPIRRRLPMWPTPPLLEVLSVIDHDRLVARAEHRARPHQQLRQVFSK